MTTTTTTVKPTLKATINTRIETLRASERITKLELSLISREILAYVMGDDGVVEASHDIDSVNRLIAVLTPMNKKTACLFFSTFLPFAFDEQTCKFGSMQKKKALKQAGLIPEFLADAGNDIWVWAENNIKMEKKNIDYLANIVKDVAKALDEDGQDASIKDVMLAVMEGGVSGTDIMGMLEALAIDDEIVALEALVNEGVVEEAAEAPEKHVRQNFEQHLAELV